MVIPLKKKIDIALIFLLFVDMTFGSRFQAFDFSVSSVGCCEDAKIEKKGSFP